MKRLAFLYKITVKSTTRSLEKLVELVKLRDEFDWERLSLDLAGPRPTRGSYR